MGRYARLAAAKSAMVNAANDITGGDQVAKGQPTMLQTVLSLGILALTMYSYYRNQQKFQEVLTAMDLTKRQLLDAVNDATNEVASAQLSLVTEIDGVADRVGKLIAKAQDEGLTDEEQTQADAELAKLKSVSSGMRDQATRLQGIAADDSNPVPAPPPATEPASGSTEVAPGSDTAGSTASSGGEPQG